MTNRERLIDWIEEFGDDIAFCDICKRPDSDCDGCINERFADYLIEHGVIVPPCKVGDTVYYITGIGHNLVKPAKIKEIIIGEDGIKDLYVAGNGHNFENSFDIFFLTREEAERKLKELESNG